MHIYIRIILYSDLIWREANMYMLKFFLFFMPRVAHQRRDAEVGSRSELNCDQLNHFLVPIQHGSMVGRHCPRSALQMRVGDCRWPLHGTSFVFCLSQLEDPPRRRTNAADIHVCNMGHLARAGLVQHSQPQHSHREVSLHGVRSSHSFPCKWR